MMRSPAIERIERIDRRTPPSAVLLVLGQITSLQLGAALARGLVGEIGAVPTAGLRIGFAALIVGAVVRPKFGTIRRVDVPMIFAFGLLLAVMNAAFFEAIGRLPLGIVTTIEFLGPLAVVLAMARRRWDTVFGLVAASGVALITWAGGSLDGIGVAFALLAAVCRALYIVGMRRMGRRYRNVDGLGFALVAGSMVAVPLGIALGGSALFQPRVLALGVVVALLSSAIPYVLDLYALRRLPPYTFGVLISLSPAAGALIGYVLLGQRLAVLQLAGIALVVAASIAAVLAAGRRP